MLLSKKNLLSLFIATLLLAPNTGAAKPPSNEKGYYKNYLDYCLGTGNSRNICECSYNTIKSDLTTQQIGEAAYNLRAGAPADPLDLQKINLAQQACAKQAEEKSAAQKPAEPLIPPMPTSIPPLNVPPPPPPPALNADAATTPEKQEKPVDIDGAEQNFLSEIKQKKPAAPKPDKDDDAQEIKEKTSGKKSGKAEKKQYFGEYNAQYFEAAASGSLKALYAITPYLDKVDIQNEKGDTPLMVATQYAQDSVIKYLLSQKADINAQNYKKQTALHMASFMRRPDIVELLLKNKANVNAAYNGGYTPLMLAITAQDETTIKMLIKNGAANSVLDNGNTLMHIAALTNNPNIIQQIFTSGGKLEEKNKDGQTPLMVAAKANLVASVIKLLQMGADLNAVDNFGQNAYQIAFAAGARDATNAILTSVQKQQQ